jgi:hypothetical protein
MISLCRRLLSGCVLVACLVPLTSGCGRGPREGTTDPEAKLRLEQLLKIYTFYIEQRKKTPANENDFKSFIRKLPPSDRASLDVPDDFETLFTSPRDGAKFVVRYGIPKPDVGGESQPIAWEQTGAKGKRFVALSVGYVEEYEEGAVDLRK